MQIGNSHIHTWNMEYLHISLIPSRGPISRQRSLRRALQNFNTISLTPALDNLRKSSSAPAPLAVESSGLAGNLQNSHHNTCLMLIARICEDHLGPSTRSGDTTHQETLYPNHYHDCCKSMATCLVSSGSSGGDSQSGRDVEPRRLQ
jgi:hypothetical protein